MLTYADLFSGFGGATIGALAAGLTPIWGVEKDAAIAEVARANLGHVPEGRDVFAQHPVSGEDAGGG